MDNVCITLHLLIILSQFLFGSFCPLLWWNSSVHCAIFKAVFLFSSVLACVSFLFLFKVFFGVWVFFLITCSCLIWWCSLDWLCFLWCLFLCPFYQGLSWVRLIFFRCLLNCGYVFIFGFALTWKVCVALLTTVYHHGHRQGWHAAPREGPGFWMWGLLASWVTSWEGYCLPWPKHLHSLLAPGQWPPVIYCWHKLWKLEKGLNHLAASPARSHLEPSRSLNLPLSNLELPLECLPPF